jgi:polysaccharide deacetylase 2 family uncharacterized protein YibQ
MKKAVNAPKRQYSKRKTLKKDATLSPSTALKRKRTKKHTGFLKSFQLAATLTAISIFVLMAVILIHSSCEKPVNVNSAYIEFEYETVDAASVLINLDDNIPITLPEEGNSKLSANGSRNTVQPVVNNTQKTIERPAGTRPVAETVSATSNNTRLTENIAASAQKPVENKGTLIFIIDDAGNNLHELDPFLRIQAPLTIAVLPGLPYSAEAARRIRAAGKEVILHQPMEALGGQNPGPGAIYSGMNASEVRSILKRNVDEVGPVAGMNNHQGSKVTEDREMMQIILSFCMENGLYFIDSKTTARTVVPETAKRLKVKTGQRDIFIDNEQDKDSMINYIKTGLEKTQMNGSAVMIGHTWSPLLAPLLEEQFVISTREGYSIKTVSDIINK